MANPIKTSDLLNDDNLDALIAKLKALEKQLEGVDGAAEDLTKTTTALNAAEKASNEAIEKSAKDAAKLDKAYEALAAASSSTAQELNEVRAETAELNRLQKLSAKIAKEEAGSFNRLSAEYSVAVLQLNKMSKAQRETTKTGQDLTKKAKALREEMKGLKEEVGNNTLSVGDYGSALEQLGGPIGSLIRDLKLFNKGLKAQVASLRASVGGLTGSSKALKIFRLALISTGIGLFVVALGSVVAFLTRTQKGVDFVSKTMAQLGAAVSVVIDRLSTFGEGIAQILTGNFSAGFDNLEKAAKGFGAELVAETVIAGNYADAIADLDKKQIAFTRSQSESKRQVAELRAESKKLEITDAKRSKALLEQATKIQNDVYQKEIDLAQERVDILAKQQSLSKNLNEDNQELTTAIATVNDLYAQKADRERTLIAQSNTLQKSIEGTTEAIDEQAEALKAYNALIKESGAVLYPGYQEALESAAALEAEYYRLKLAGIPVDERVLKGIEDRTAAILAERAARAGTAPAPAQLASREIFAEAEIVLDTTETSAAVQQIIDDAENVESAFDKINNSLVNFSKKYSEEIDVTVKSFNIIRDTLLELSRLETEAADIRLANSDRVVDGLQSNLETELELRNQGLANRAQSVNEELNLAKTAQNEALKQKEAADEKARKLNAAAAASNLIVAAAKIFGSFPILYAIPLVALMVSSFIATTAKAKQLAKENFAEGDLSIVGGGSHASGRDTMVGMEGNKAQFAEKGEARMILDKQRTREYKSLLPVVFQALKSGTFNEQFKHVSEAGKDIPFFAPTVNVNTKIMERYLKAIKDQGNKSVTFDGKGRRIERAKGITRIYN